MVFHKSKKLSAAAWAKIVDTGKLTAAIKRAHPARGEGPWERDAQEKGRAQTGLEILQDRLRTRLGEGETEAQETH